LTTTPPVVFDFPTFAAMFPEFSGLNATIGLAYFTRATGSIIANAATNPANADGNLMYLVYLATAHVAWLNSPKDASGNPSATGQPASPLVGRISSASEGSVSVQTEWPANDPTAQQNYLSQTRYGVELWTALAPYRTARYLARPTRVINVPFGRGRGCGGWC
jgi:hypothetical protein